MLAAPRAGEVTLKLDEPLLIYSRFDLNRLLLERAERAGAQIEKTRITELSRSGSRLAAPHQGGNRRRGFLRGRHRRAQPAARRGHPAQAGRHDVRAGLLRPRRAGPASTFSSCRAWKATSGSSRAAGIFPWGSAGRASPPAPCASGWSNTWRSAASPGKTRRSTATCCRRSRLPRGSSNRVAGEGWMAVGDAAGLVDPITGEGLYYAIRSADLAAQVLLSDAAEPAERRRPTGACCGAISRPTWNSDRASPSASSWDASCSARCRRGWCNSRAAARASRRSCRTCSRATQPYLGLKRRLLQNLNGSLYDIAMSFGSAAWCRAKPADIRRRSTQKP